MKKIKLTILIIVIVVMMFILSGCTSSVAETENRFKKIYSEELDTYTYLIIICDKETKVMYSYTFSPRKTMSSALTILVDSEGKPLLYEGE